MNVLLLNQCFYPDVMATAQQLTDLAVGLVKQGHRVTVIASDRGYDDPSRRFPRREVWNGVEIIRIRSLALGKDSRWRRAVNFASFLTSCTLTLLTQRRFDVVVALTSPPLISFLGSLFVKLRGGEFFCWVMDLNPDEAIAAGWLKQGSLLARVLDRLLRFSFRQATGIIALDHFMKARIVGKGISEQRVTVLPPWAQDENIKFDEQGREAFRRQHGLADSFVVMYAGNHSPCHPLTALVEAAQRLSSRKKISFCFVGGGSEQGKVKEFAALHQLANIRCLPYQPFDGLAASLSAADLHVVVMGDGFVGIVHPSKIYNILGIGSPFLYIGPKDSHISEIAAQSDESFTAYSATNGDVESVVTAIEQAVQEQSKDLQRTPPPIVASFSRSVLLPRLIKVLESQADVQPLISNESESSRYMSATH